MSRKCSKLDWICLCSARGGRHRIPVWLRCFWAHRSDHVHRGTAHHPIRVGDAAFRVSSSSSLWPRRVHDCCISSTAMATFWSLDLRLRAWRATFPPPTPPRWLTRKSQGKAEELREVGGSLSGGREESRSSEATFTSVETDVWNKSSVLSANLKAASAPCALSPPPVGNGPPDCSNEVSKPENNGRFSFCCHDNVTDLFPWCVCTGGCSQASAGTKP